MAEFKLSAEDIQIKIHADSWQTALRKAAKPLIDQGNITTDYVENMIKAVIKYGPYIVIAPGLALGHAEPDASVIKTGYAITTLAEPVTFGSKENDPVDIVVVLASINSTDHLKLLQKLVGFLGNADNIKALRKMSTEKDALDVVQAISKG
ncbi:MULTISPECIES: PTS sugar transporter subunit IIA [Lacticaseibacillus]|uniref:Ascorbate-specific PTS system EIIA component n=2 Tax=Lacticaseibacillus TaxID=2759736 RepID=A0AAN1C6B8_LACCA|nr:MULTISPECIES: PTS sugar transporter subunit IIA [Lacticaseibacillus]ARY90542.1 transcriptional antiterminator [Lacticaseibacillus casei]KAB1970400.1 PTS sugar transporter subunit IIA [Lacticaseibacillus casei]WLV81160.1 PTS sugar transporter subunit IIA [Lacticaseibacillus sp. NCIMB 15473]WNX25120.1 PTS sugar transporter subunit IIA [Lacticaseibacillus casei]WNX27891.1 PTS sugar transporter subunit IIA [Lacticaseibacillus casei]